MVLVGDVCEIQGMVTHHLLLGLVVSGSTLREVGFLVIRESPVFVGVDVVEAGTWRSSDLWLRFLLALLVACLFDA